MRTRALHALEPVPDWFEPMLDALFAAHPAAPPDEDALVRWLGGFVARRRESGRSHATPHVLRWLSPAPTQRPLAPGIPRLDDTSALARALRCDVSTLLWLADARRYLGRAEEGPLTHYRVRVRRKRRGGLRVLEAPKPRLKRAQRWVLDHILHALATHDAAMGFVPGRSVYDHAARHAGRALVVRVDLADFFPSVPAARVRHVFARAGYGDETTSVLTGLATHEVGLSRLRAAGVAPTELAFSHRQKLTVPHLPQGAPTSPALANLCARRLDARLEAAAARVGARYSRYADDLVFSGDATFARSARRFIDFATRIVLDEGFSPNYRKTRFMPAHDAQRVAGLVVNDAPRAPRAEVDRLEAMLFNASRRGLDAENRDAQPDFEAHLAGRIAWVSRGRPKRAARLRTLLDAARARELAPRT